MQLGTMALSISTLIHEGIVYMSVPCVSYETMMSIYNENMHMFIMECQRQKQLRRNAPVFTPASQIHSKYFNNINNYYYNKQKVLKQLSNGTKVSNDTMETEKLGSYKDLEDNFIKSPQKNNTQQKHQDSRNHSTANSSPEVDDIEMNYDDEDIASNCKSEAVVKHNKNIENNVSTHKQDQETPRENSAKIEHYADTTKPDIYKDIENRFAILSDNNNDIAICDNFTELIQSTEESKEYNKCHNPKNLPPDSTTLSNDTET